MSTLEWLNKKQLNASFYRESINKYSPYDVKSLHWNSKESQMKRFFSLNRIGILNNASILDIGCGTGDLLDFLVLQEIIPSYYYGIDLIPDFIQVAQERHQSQTFICADFFETTPPLIFDYALCNGALNIKVENNYLYLEEFIIKTLPFFKKALGITLLKDSPFYLKDRKIFHYEEEMISRLLKRLSLNFKIYNDYADNDFTLMVFKADV